MFNSDTLSHEQASSNPKSLTPTEIFTSSDPNFADYVRLKDFIKKTGIEEKDCHAFAVKELCDNSADFIEKHSYSNTTIVLEIINDKKNNVMIISVSNPNFGNIPVFNNLDQTFNYKRSYSSKSNQYRVTRGAQGDALKELGTMGYMLSGESKVGGGGGGEGENNLWNYPIVIQHNRKIDRVYIEVDRKHRSIKPRFERPNICNSTDTKVTIILPAISNIDEYKRLKVFCYQYTLFNTHLSYDIYFDGKHVAMLQALHPITEHYDNLNSAYCYSTTELYDFLSDICGDNVSIYDALAGSGFREINQPGRFDDLKGTTIEELTFDKLVQIHKRLKKSMLAMSKLSVPYDSKVVKRKDALIARTKQLGTEFELDFNNARYERTKDPKHDSRDLVYDNNIIRYPWCFEILAIPIKNQTGRSTIISGVNYSTSINNQLYFKADKYENGYSWFHKNGTRLRALDIEEILRVSAAGADISYNDSMPSNKQRQPCLIIAHLVSQRPEYKFGYGKSTLKLEAYSTQIAETIERLVKRIPLQNRVKPSKEYKSVTAYLDELLQKRWDTVRRNPSILNRYSGDYDPWTQSTVWYHLREEYLLPIEKRYGVVLIKANTRKDVTAMITERCEKLEGSPKREELGIFASPRATMYVNRQWHRVDVDDIPELAGKGTDVIFIEKQGIVEIIKHLADIYGHAFVNTQGHFADYPRELVPRIVNEGGNVAILTDFDCAGIHIAERIVAEDEVLKKGVATRSHYGERVKRLGIDLDTLNYFAAKIEKGTKIEEGGGGIKVNVRNDDGELVEKQVRTSEELKELVEEPYPKAEQKDEKQQPGMNVITPIIRYARKYVLSTSASTYDGYSRSAHYGKYKYIYDNFEYLTGLNVDDVIKLINIDHDNDELDNEEKAAINKLLRSRDPVKAKRIELDSVIKVVRANLFAALILDKLQEFFPERKYTRAVRLPSEYFGEKFHILPENIKELFRYYTEVADKAVKPTEEEIEKELDHWDPTDEEIKRGTPRLLKTYDEDALIELRTSKAVTDNKVMQALNEKAGEILDSLPPLKSANNGYNEDDEESQQQDDLG